MKSRHYACILAGGSGERFWPMSRVRKPKHLLKLFSDRTLIEETARRLEGVVPSENIFVLTNEAQLEGVRSALPFVPASQIVAEPVRRDTGPAAALATAMVCARDPEGVVALLPADAFIRDSRRFAAQLNVAFELASGKGWACPDAALFTFAVKPTFPSTGFGYLELGDPVAVEPVSGDLRKVIRFVEKPDAAIAKSYFESRRYAWNAGMFLWRARTFLREADRLEPALAARPGRVDLASELPIPDPDGRRRLLELYGVGLQLNPKDLPALVADTQGASPAFIRELLRRAALLASERSGGELVVDAGVLKAALRELTSDGGPLTARLLGMN